MKRKIIGIALTVSLLFALCGCGKVATGGTLYEHFANRDAKFELATQDVNAAFREMFAQHPEQAIYLESMSYKTSILGSEVTVKYINTDVNAEDVMCGTEEEVALASLEKALSQAAPGGMMVLTDGGKIDAEKYNKQLAKENYPVTMGLQSSNWQVTSNQMTDAVVVSYTLEYQASAEKVLACREAVQKEVEKLGKTLWQADTAPEARVRSIHDYLINQTVYNTKEERALEDHCPYGPLIEGKGVCDGYTRAAGMLLDAAGIENYYVDGSAGGEEHSWNIVKLDGQYYHLDVTWDDPVDPSGKQHLTYDYYLKSDADFLLDHTWQDADLPPCPKNYK